MARFLIDANLPAQTGLWKGDEFLHMRDLNERWTDAEIWEYARTHSLIIVSKDADFSDRVMLSDAPPRVVHIRVGNVRLWEITRIVEAHWPWIAENIERFRLIRMYADRVEGVSADP